MFKVFRDRDWIIEPSKEGQRMLMQEGMWQELWVQEERYEVPQWMLFLQWELLHQRCVRGMWEWHKDRCYFGQ